jgi:hypothetical protein
VGSAEELRRHAEVTGCQTFRRTTLVISSEGKLLDKLVEVYQLPAWEQCREVTQLACSVDGRA